MRLASLLVLAVITATAFADDVDDLIKREMKAQGIPGLTVAVVRDGKAVKVKGYGFANLEHRVPAKPETIYQSGSIGKQFAATLVMMLVRDGKMSLDDPITKWFPENEEVWKGILVRHLLSHTSGIEGKPYDGWNFQRPLTEDALVKLIATQKPITAPGAAWKYSNAGYALLGVLIRRVTGEFYGDLLQTRIFKPLGMNTARIISERDIVANRAAGYELTKDGPKNQEWVDPTINTTADGALYLTALDFVKWDAALRTQRLLPLASLDQMWTPTVLTDGKRVGYGFGWGLESKDGVRYVEHGGAWQGFTTFILRQRDKGYTVVVLTNLDAGHSDPGKIGRAVMAMYLAKPK